MSYGVLVRAIWGDYYYNPKVGGQLARVLLLILNVTFFWGGLFVWIFFTFYRFFSSKDAGVCCYVASDLFTITWQMKRIFKKPKDATDQPMFVEFVLKNIWHLYAITMNKPNKEKVPAPHLLSKFQTLFKQIEAVAKTLDLKILPR